MARKSEWNRYCDKIVRAGGKDPREMTQAEINKQDKKDEERPLKGEERNPRPMMTITYDVETTVESDVNVRTGKITPKKETLKVTLLKVTKIKHPPSKRGS